MALLHTQTVNTFVITARECTRAFADWRAQQRPGLRSWVAGIVDTVGVEARIAAMHFLAWWAGFKVHLQLPGQQRPRQAGQLTVPGGLPS